MDALGVPAVQRGMYLGMFRANWGVSHRVQFVATYDIGWFAARALEDPERYAGRVIPLAGDELNIADIIRTYQDRHRAQALGRADSRLRGQEDDAEGVRGHVPLDPRKGLRG